MAVEIRTRGFTLTPGLRAHVGRRLGFALDRFHDRIARVRIVLEDVNGPRGGPDKRCRIELVLRDARTVRASASSHDAYAAVDGAARRAARSLHRALSRERAATLELLWLAQAMAARSEAA